MRVFFEMQDSDTWRDDQGDEYASLAAAQCAAVQMLADSICGNPGRFWKADVYKIIATDAARLTLFEVELVATMAPALAAHRRMPA
jgi:hypothetical protein